MISLTGKPSVAYAIAGASTSAKPIVPKRVRIWSQPSTAPGTVQVSGPVPGIRSRPWRVTVSRLISYGARPVALSP